MHIKIVEETYTESVGVEKAVRQSNPLSPTLFTLAVKNVSLWENRGTNVDGEYLLHLISDDIEQLKTTKKN